MNFDFSRKVVLITGGYGGIGLATAKMFKECYGFSDTFEIGFCYS